MSSMKKAYAAAMMFAAIAASAARAGISDERERPKKKPIPKGCQEYEFYNPYFKTVASSKKKAVEKYEKFKESQQ